jgi:glycine/D-amino acid oxidase-like deaminating enzyme
MQQARSTATTDIVIFGGGIAGLWLLNRLRQQGYDVILLESDALGGGQSLASQGIIHGGLKYALNGVLSPASSAIAQMPERWRSCLQGEGDVDLRGCKVLAPHYFMWSGGGYRSRLKSFLGSKALRGRIDALKPAQYPAFFRNQSSGRRAVPAD